jgi:membrane-bound lytic murein transglycosylase B
VARATVAKPVAQKPEDNKLTAGATVGELAAMGLRFSTDLPAAAPAGLVVLEGEDGLEYWAAFHNFYVITRYNRSAMYALAVYQLGQAVGEAVRSDPGGAPVVSGSP